MDKKKSMILLLVVLLLVAVSGSLVAGTYAKYTAELNDASGTAQVAKWSFAEDNTLDALAFTLADTVDASTLTANKIAPGTKGSFNIKLVNTNSDVAVDFTIALKSIENAPTNLKLYADAAHTKELNTSKPITGVLAAEDSEGVTATIYWVWDYEQTGSVETGDQADTTDGKKANDMTVTINVSGVQKQPSATAVTSKINK